jgi:hypothetical protein
MPPYHLSDMMYEDRTSASEISTEQNAGLVVIPYEPEASTSEMKPEQKPGLVVSSI